MKKWLVRYDINGGEYVGRMIITATRVYYAEMADRRIIMADGMRIEMEEDVLSIEPLV